MIRAATAADLPAIFDIYRENESRGETQPPPRPTVPPWLGHVLATGTLLVAERGGAPVGYAGLTRRDDVAFLTDLFVRPGAQSGGIGGALLRAIMPGAARVRCTFASDDTRALALYIRAGLTPQWPQFSLLLDRPSPPRPPATTVATIAASAADPELIAWERAIGGRHRPEDIRFWIAEQHGVPLLFRRGGDTVGYGFVRLAVGTPHHPAAAIGPLGALDAADAADCTLAAVAWAREQAATIQIAVPGPHPALRPLLDAGFAIAWTDTFLSSAVPPFDPRRYLTSGGDLC